jgi:hypothetical protein
MKIEDLKEGIALVLIDQNVENEEIVAISLASVER